MDNERDSFKSFGREFQLETMLPCYEYSWLSNIVAYLAYLAQSFFLISNGIMKYFDTCLSMQIQKNMSVSIAGYLVEWF